MLRLVNPDLIQESQTQINVFNNDDRLVYFSTENGYDIGYNLGNLKDQQIAHHFSSRNPYFAVSDRLDSKPISTLEMEDANSLISLEVVSKCSDMQDTIDKMRKLPILNEPTLYLVSGDGYQVVILTKAAEIRNKQLYGRLVKIYFDETIEVQSNFINNPLTGYVISEIFQPSYEDEILEFERGIKIRPLLKKHGLENTIRTVMKDEKIENIFF